MIIWLFEGSNAKLTVQGKSKAISKSKTKNKMPIKKNRMENGSPGVWKGSNPHSYTDTFSLSGAFSLNT